MKPATTLKELLKPPFERRGIFRIRDSQNLLIEIDMLSGDAYKLQNDFGDFVVAAMNEKWERDFGEPLRWITCYIEGVEYMKCPKCNWDDLNTDHEDIFNYCPSCGRRVWPPKEK